MHIFRINLPGNIASDGIINILGNTSITPIKHLNINDDVSMPTNTSDYEKLYGFGLSNGEINNFLSHKKVWKQFINMSLPWCLIVESNITLSLSVQDLIQTINELPAAWDVFFPYDQKFYVLESFKKSNGSTLINQNGFELSINEPYLSGYKHGNSIYFLSKSGAEKLLKLAAVTDRLDHTFLKMMKEKTLDVYMSNVSWFTQNQINDYEWPDRCQSILDIAVRQGAWNDIRLSRARYLLTVISNIGIQNNIDLVLDAGTLLGYVRHGGMMLWDDDFDIGIEKKNLPSFFKVLEKYKNIRYAGGFNFRGTPFYKIWNTEGEEIEKYPYTFPFIDIWAYNRNGNDIIYENGNKYPNAVKNNFKEVLFEGSKYKIPWNAIEVLDSRYVNWRKMIRVYTWCHREEKNNFKYLHIPIKTDETGRMLSFT